MTEYFCGYCGADTPAQCQCGLRADTKYGAVAPKVPTPFPSFTDEEKAKITDFAERELAQWMGFEVRVKDPDTGGEKGSKPQRMDLLPWDTLMKVSEHYHYGASKYEDRNWERGYKWSLSFAALQRHLAAFWQGEDVDEESGSHHMAAACFHALALFTYVERGLGTDDRPSGRSEASER